MASIGEILEEEVKKSLNYDKKSDSDQRKRFNRLRELCLINNIAIKQKGHFVEGVRIGIYSSRAGDDGTYHNESFFVWAKPIIKHGKLYLSIKEIKRTIDASYVDCFGSKIHKLS